MPAMPLHLTPRTKASLKKQMFRTASMAVWATMAVVTLAPSVGFAIDWDSYATDQGDVDAAPTLDNKILDLTLLGEISKVGGTAVVNTDKTGTKISVNLTNTADGISSTGDHSTIAISGTGVLDQITVTKGTITGEAATAGKGTLAIGGADAATAISIGADGVIANTAVGGDAIVIGGTNTFTGTITNAGTISTTNDAGSIAIDVADKVGATVGITNTGTINAGALGKAINVGTNTKATIAQNGGTVTGAVIMGGNAASTLAVSGGTINGNVTMNNAGQNITLGGGQINGTIDGAGQVTSNTAYVSNGNIGAGTGITKLIINDGKSFDAAANNNSIKATNVVVGSGGAGTAVLTLGTGVVTGAIDGDVAGKGIVNLNGTQALGGNIGANAALSEINVGTGATIDAATGNNDLRATKITVADTAVLQLGTTAVTGNVEGAVAGKGTVAFKGSQTVAGNMGAATALEAITVGAGATVDAATGNRDLRATTVTIADTGTLQLGTKAVTGNIEGGLAGKGKLDIKGSQVLAGNIGAATALEAITIGTGATVDAATGNRDLRATTLSIENGGVLQLGTTAVTGAIEGAVAGQGTVAFKGSHTIAGTVGAVNKLAAVTIADGANMVLDNTLKATAVTVGGGASGKLTVNGGKTLTGDVAIANGGTLELTVGGSPGTIAGAINGTAPGAGTFALIGGSGNFTTTQAIAATNSLAAFNVGDGLTANLGHNIKATNVALGGGASGTVNQTAGTITATTTAVGAGATLTQTGTGKIAGNVTMGAGSNLSIEGGQGVTGTIDGAGGANGIVTVKSAYTNTGAIGSVNGINTLALGSGGTLTMGADIKAADTTVGTGARLNMGNTARSITGNMTGSTTGIIDIGGAGHAISGNLTTASTNTLGVRINTNLANDSGSLAVGGTASIAANTRLDVNVAAPGYIANGTRYTVLTGVGTNVNNTLISDNSAVLTFSEDLSVAGKRTIIASRELSYEDAAQSFNTQNVGATLEGIGSAGTGELAQFQAHLDTLTTAGQVDRALQEIVPQADNSLSAQTISTTVQANNQVSTRLASVRAGTTYAKAKSGVPSGNDISDSAFWVQGFGTKGDQGARNGVAGYDARTVGGAVGVDTITSDDGRGRMGISGSYAQTSIKAKGATRKETDANSYQANLYGTYNGNRAYVEGMMGVAFHTFESSRQITAPALTAKADYNGYTYTASGSTGYRFGLGRNLDIVPNMGISYYGNQIEKYTETGAGTLNMQVDNDNSQAVIGRLGMNLGYTVRKKSMFIRPELRFAYLHDFIGDKQATTARFTGGGATFRTEGFAPAVDSYVIGASLNLVTYSGFSFNADYDYEMKESYDAHSGLLRARFDL